MKKTILCFHCYHINSYLFLSVWCGIQIKYRELVQYKELTVLIASIDWRPGLEQGTIRTKLDIFRSNFYNFLEYVFISGCGCSLRLCFVQLRKNYDFYHFLCVDLESFVSGSVHITKRRKGVFK